MRPYVLSLCIVYLAVGSLLSWGAGFAPAVQYQVGHNLCSVAVADFNNDGFPDVLAADFSGFYILLGNGDGTVQSPIMTATVPRAACWPNIADFNLDGKVDVAISYVDGSEQVFLGNGDGTFHSVGQSGSFSRPTPIADFNEDGIPDLLLVDTNEKCNATVVLGNGDGTFRKGTSIQIPNCLVVRGVVGDFNGDGHKDVLLVESGECIVIDYRVALGKGDGTFRPTLIRSTQNSDAIFFLSADLNHDGIDDLVLSDDSRLGVQFANQHAMFPETFPEYCDAGAAVESMAMGDFNADGLPDVVMAPVAGLPLMVGLGQPGGKFHGCKTFNAGTFSFAVAAGDLNGDGADDIVAGDDVDPGTVSVLLAIR